MSIKTPDYLKSRFQNGDLPGEEDFADLIDTTAGVLAGRGNAFPSSFGTGANDVARGDAAAKALQAANTYTDEAIAGLGEGLTVNETDPVFTAHVAYGITGTLINYWNSAYGWGDHALAGYALASSLSGYVPTTRTVCGHTLSSDVTLSANDIGGFNVTNPTIGQTLIYSGSEFVNGPPQTVNAGPGVVYFLSATPSGVGSYDLMSKTPDSAGELDEYVTVNAGGSPALLDGYLADAAVGVTEIPGGVWDFNVWCYVSAASGTSSVRVDVYKRSAGGTETLLFQADSGEINWTTVGMASIETVQQPFTVSATDKLLFKLWAVTDSGTDVDVHLVHSGTEHYTHVHVPLVVGHNDIPGLQGGSGGQYYHLTGAERTAVQGLGGAASKNVGTTAGTVAAGDDSRMVNALQKDGSVAATGDLDMAGHKVKRPQLEDIRETLGTATFNAGTLTLDLSTGNTFAHTLTANVTSVVFSNCPATGQAVPVTLEITQDGTGGRTVSGWQSGCKWPGGTAPTITATASAVDVITGYTRDGGTTWRLARAMADSK